MIGPSGIAPRAQRQLAAWQDLARDWAYELAERGGQEIIVCTACGWGLWLATDSTGTAYQYSPEDQQAAIVLHLRTRHADLEPAGL